MKEMQSTYFLLAFKDLNILLYLYIKLKNSKDLKINWATLLLVTV